MAFGDTIRAKAFAAMQRLPGRAAELANKANEALGRPLADAYELADRRAFAHGRGNVDVVAQPAPKQREQAPVIVYFVDRKEQSREVGKLADILTANGIVFTVTDITEDPAAQFAVRRDSKGLRLPVVFVAGECVGGREQLVNAASSGELEKKVFG